MDQAMEAAVRQVVSDMVPSTVGLWEQIPLLAAFIVLSVAVWYFGSRQFAAYNLQWQGFLEDEGSQNRVAMTTATSDLKEAIKSLTESHERVVSLLHSTYAEEAKRQSEVFQSTIARLAGKVHVQ